jgi:tight adherence protein C
VILIASLLAAAALFSLRMAWNPPAPSLTRQLERLYEPPTESIDALRSRWQHLAVGTLSALSIGDRSRLHSDLAICDQTIERYAATRLSLALTGAATPTVLALTTALALGTEIVWGGVVILAGALAAAGYLLPAMTLRRNATSRRREFRYALNLFLELVVIAVEGGEGPQAALRKAADAGHGWAFGALRRTLTTAWLESESPWRSLKALGERIGSAELVELAAAVELAATKGAPPQQSLRAKAATVRDHEHNDMRADAISASTRMGGPMVGLFVGFLIMIGYPALTLIINL